MEKNNFKILVPNANGMALMQVLLSASLIGLMSVGIVKQSKLLFQGQKDNRTRFDVDGVDTSIGAILSSRENCKATLANTTLNLTPNPSPAVNISSGGIFINSNGTAAYSVGSTIDDFILSSITVSNRKPQDGGLVSSNSSGYVNLICTYTNAKGIQIKKKTIPLAVVTDSSNLITDCKDTSDNNLDAYCGLVGGSTDSQTDRCNFEIGAIVPVANGTCPPGYFLAEGSNNTTDMRARFIKGKKISEAVGSVGDSSMKSHSLNFSISHTHGYNPAAHSHSYGLTFSYPSHSHITILQPKDMITPMGDCKDYDHMADNDHILQSNGSAGATIHYSTTTAANGIYDTAPAAASFNTGITAISVATDPSYGPATNITFFSGTPETRPSNVALKYCQKVTWSAYCATPSNCTGI